MVRRCCEGGRLPSWLVVCVYVIPGGEGGGGFFGSGEVETKCYSGKSVRASEPVNIAKWSRGNWSRASELPIKLRFNSDNSCSYASKMLAAKPSV